MTQCANVYDVIYCKKSVTLKLVYNKKKIQIFGMNMAFISSSEAKNAYFMSGEIHSKNLNILYILPRLSREGYIHWLYWNSRTLSSSDVIAVKMTSSCELVS